MNKKNVINSILENTKTTKERILPLKGEVHVTENVN